MTSLYDSDVLLWSEQQAGGLRAFARTQTPEEIDWLRIASAIERVGAAAQERVEAGLRAILAQAIAGYCDSDSPLRHARNARALGGRLAAQRSLTPTIRARLDLDRLWREAFDRAMTEIPRRILGVPPSIPRKCPFTLDELLDEGFTYDRAVERLYILLTSWRPKAGKDTRT